MGTNRVDYVILGYKWDSLKEFDKEVRVVLQLDDDIDVYDPLSKYYDNEYRDEICSCDGMSIILDGMCGDYALAGMILSKGNIDHGRCSGLDLVDCTPNSADVNKVRRWGKEFLGRTDKPRVYAVTHAH